MDKYSTSPVFEKFNDIYYKRFIVGFLIVLIIGLGFAGYKINEIRTRGYEVFLGDNSLGYVRDENIAIALMNEYNDSLSNTYDLEVVFEENLSFKARNIDDDSLITTTQLNRNIKDKAGYLVSAFALKIKGEEIGVIGSRQDANAILEVIKEPYISNLEENVVLKDVDILEDIELSSINIWPDEIVTSEEMVEMILTGGEEIKTHTIEVGESFWTIAKIYDMPLEELMESNPGLDEKSLKPGDLVTISRPSSKLTVVTKEEVQRSEKVDYQVILEHDNTMWEDEKTIKVEGKSGKANITTVQTKHNGGLVESEIIGQEIIEEPINQVVIQGSKERPKTVATGSFRVPTRGRVSSRYGMRSGRMHRGLDIAAPTGTPIYASDGGIVTYSGRKGTYGNMVEINHENGYKTRYAHASKMHVKVGTRVYKGQHIANVGNTGRSTGPHLHFEVLVNGSQRNPSGFINK